MDDPLRVRRVQRIAHLNPEVQKCFGLERSGSDKLLERLALQQLHRHERLALELTNVVNRADVGVVERGSRLGFAAEALQSLLIVRQSLGQELEGDEAIEARVLRLIHYPHAAATELFEDTIMGNCLADHGN